MEESKYVFKENKMPEYITDDVEISLMRKIPMKKTLIKKAMIKKIMVKNNVSWGHSIITFALNWEGWSIKISAMQTGETEEVICI